MYLYPRIFFDIIRDMRPINWHKWAMGMAEAKSAQPPFECLAALSNRLAAPI